jgi:formamidase
MKCDVEVLYGAGSSIRFPHVIGGGQLRNAEPSRFHAVIGLPVKDAGWVPPHLAYLDSPKSQRFETCRKI